MATSPSLSQPRLVGLDLLRLLAIVLVLGRHMPSIPESWPAGVKLFFLTWRQGGWVGVDLFFVLNGFLVSGLLFTEYKSRGHLGVGRFYMRRGWKIYPPFFVLIAASVLIALREWLPIPSVSLASELFFLASLEPGLGDATTADPLPGGRTGSGGAGMPAGQLAGAAV